MSASLLYHTNQIEDVQVLKEEYYGDKILFEAVLISKKTLCPCCGSNDSIAKGQESTQASNGTFRKQNSYSHVEATSSSVHQLPTYLVAPNPLC